jgi:hypothetical protein
MKTLNSAKLILVIFTIIFSINSVYSQAGIKRKEIKDKIEAQKIAFITKELNLTTQEAQQFWPVYNEYAEKNEEILKSMGKKNIETKFIDLEEISDKEALEIADEQIVSAQKLLDLRKKYHIEFKKILPPKKLLKLYIAEKEFKRFLLKEIKDRKLDRRR